VRAALAALGACLGLAAAWWLAGAGAWLYGPYAVSNDELDLAAVVSLGISAVVLCPLLGGMGWWLGGCRKK
jgi:hypothetical protein